jgi:hypothetical protein
VRLEMTEKLPFQASRDSQQVISFDGVELIAKGFIMDKIDGLGSRWPPDEEEAEAESGNQIVQPSHNLNPYKDEAGFRDALWRTLVLNRDGAGDVAPDCYAGLLDVPWPGDDDEPSSLFLMEYHVMRTVNRNLRIGDREFEKYFPVGTAMDVVMAGMKDCLDPFHRIFTTGYGRRLLITAQGFIGMARNEAQQGDIVCILLGCSIPVILRPSADHLSYKLVGESYIQGVMDGEAMEGLKGGQYKLEDFVIC